MKLVVKLVIGLIFAGILIVAIAAVLLRAERELAIDVASGIANRALANPTEFAQLQIPDRARAQQPLIKDTDRYGRTWIVWFDLGGFGSLVVSVVAKRGVAFLPMFNGAEQLSLSRIEYLEE